MMASSRRMLDRLTTVRALPDQNDQRRHLPKGDHFPLWSALPLDAKLPMLPSPKGAFTLYTTKYCRPKYLRKSGNNFDLSDPNAFSISNEYNSLHDPHLRDHFSQPRMRKLLHKSGFITDSGKVVCSLKEFNKYRQFLKRLCLVDNMNKKKGSLKMAPKSSGLGGVKDNTGRLLTKRYTEDRHKDCIRSEDNYAKELLSIRNKNKIADRLRRERDRPRQEAMIMKRQEEEEQRARQSIKHAEEDERRKEERRQMILCRDENYALRLDEIRKKREDYVRAKSTETWEAHKRHQAESLSRDAEIRARLKEETELDIASRDRWLRDKRYKQMAHLERIKAGDRRSKEEHERLCAERLEAKLALSNKAYGTDSFSSVRGEQLQNVLDRLSFSDLCTANSENLLRVLNNSTEGSAEPVSENDVETIYEMRQFASGIIQKVIGKVRKEIYPAYLRLLMTNNALDSHMEMDAEYSSDEEVGQQTAGSSSRSVKFSKTEAVIPRSLENLDLRDLKPVSQHTLTPVPSPPICDETNEGDAFNFGDPRRNKATKSSLVETLLLRLLYDLIQGRINYEELLKLSGYAVEVLRVFENGEANRTFCAQVADDLVRFTFGKILEDVKSGALGREELTAITQSIIKEALGSFVSDGVVSDKELHYLVSGALSQAVDRQDGEEAKEKGVMMLDDLISATLGQVKTEIMGSKLSEEEIQEIGSVVVNAVMDEIILDDSVRADASIKEALQSLLSDRTQGSIVNRVMDKVLTPVIKSYRPSASDGQHILVKEFVVDVLDKVMNGIAAGDFSEADLQLMIATRVKQGGTRILSQADVVQVMQSLISQIDSGQMSDLDVEEIGSALVETGRQLLVTKEMEGIPGGTTGAVESDLKTVIDSVKEHSKDERKEAVVSLTSSVLACSSVSKLAVTGSDIGDVKDCRSYLARKQSGSYMAADVVLAAMNRIAKDLADDSIAECALASIVLTITDMPFERVIAADSSLSNEMKKALANISESLKNDQVAYEEAKHLFSIMLQTYISKSTPDQAELLHLDSEDTVLIKDVVNEALNKVIRSVAVDMSDSVVALRGKTRMRLASVASDQQLEDFIWDALHIIGHSSSSEFMLNRPKTQFVSDSSKSLITAEDMEAIAKVSLSAVARELSHDILSETSVTDSVDMALKLLDFVNSILSELQIGFKGGKVPISTITYFLNDISEHRDFTSACVDDLQEHLCQVIEDVKSKKMASAYFQPIAERFSKSSMFIQSEENPLSNVDSEVIKTFVESTLKLVLGELEIQDSVRVKSSSIAKIVAEESPAIVKKVVDTVINRIEKDTEEGNFLFDETSRRAAAEVAETVIEQLIFEVQTEVSAGSNDVRKMHFLNQFMGSDRDTTRSPTRGSNNRLPVANDFSQHVFNTINTVLSELGPETVNRKSSSVSSCVLDDYIHTQLKSAVSDLRKGSTDSAYKVGVPSSKLRHKSISIDAALSSKDVVSYIAYLLNNVIDELIMEKTIQTVQIEHSDLQVARSKLRNNTSQVILRTTEASSTSKTDQPKESGSSRGRSKSHCPSTNTSLTPGDVDSPVVSLRAIKSPTSGSFAMQSVGSQTVQTTSAVNSPVTSQQVIPVVIPTEGQLPETIVLSGEPLETTINQGAQPPETSEQEEVSKVSNEVATYTLAALKKGISSGSCDAEDNAGTPKVIIQQVSSTSQFLETLGAYSCGLVAEIVSQTITNIKEGRVSTTDLESMAQRVNTEPAMTGGDNSHILDILEGVQKDLAVGQASTSRSNDQQMGDQRSTSYMRVDVKDALLYIADSLTNVGVETNAQEEMHDTNVNNFLLHSGCTSSSTSPSASVVHLIRRKQCVHSASSRLRVRIQLPDRGSSTYPRLITPGFSESILKATHETITCLTQQLPFEGMREQASVVFPSITISCSDSTNVASSTMLSEDFSLPPCDDDVKLKSCLKQTRKGAVVVIPSAGVDSDE